MSKAAIFLIPLVILGLVVVGGFGIYNALISAQEETRIAWAKVENQYQGRADLISPLVEMFKSHAVLEKEVLAAVTLLRNQWGAARQSGDMQRTLQAAEKMENAVGRMMDLAERYPEIKSHQGFRKLQNQLEDTERSIRAERRRFNESALNYNRKIDTFPGFLFIEFFGFQRKPLFEAE